MQSITIEQITIPMRKEELLRWKEHDISIVPEFVLKSKGNGVSNGYGFGEWMVEKHFRSLGYYVINDEFDLFSKVSKYKRYNGIITSIIGREKMDIFKDFGRRLYEKGIKLENLDLFVYNLDSFFFAEVKKGRDFLRPPQIRFMYLAQEILHTASKMICLSEEAKTISKNLLTFDTDFSLNTELEN